MSENKKTERTLNKNIIERLIIITNRIKSGVYPNTKDLLDYYEAKTGDKSSIATISRDLNTLCTSFHAPLYFDKSKNGYYFSDDNWQFALNSISSKDIFYLSAAKSLLAALDGNPIYQEIKDAINFVINTQSKANEELLRRIAVPPKPKLCIDEEVWHLLSLALLENKVITFDYKTRGKDSPERRTVRPYQLLIDSYECCLYGYAKERSATRLYNIARIKNITLTNEVFELPKDYDFSSKCGGGKFGAYSSDKAEEYIIDFYADSRPLLKECIWADDQTIINYDEDDCTEIRFTSTQSEKILEWVLSQGANAVPIAPPSLVAYWKEQRKS